MTYSKIKLLASVLLSIAFVFTIFSYVVLTFDPFRWGVTHSSRFSWRKFERVKRGERIADVIKQLGEPVHAAEPLIILTGDHVQDSCIQGGCKSYYFAGGLWGPTFREAIVVTDSRGFVVYTEKRQE